MILPIYVYGQPVLRQVAEDITVDYPNLKELIENMFETMDHADGVDLPLLRSVCLFVSLLLIWMCFLRIIPNIKIFARLI